MIYKDFQDLRLSALGMGCMRLPVKPDSKEIDVDAVKEMVAYAMAHGINYYDTAWGYHDGNSELVMGEVLSAYPRDSFYLSSKFPGYDLSNFDKVEAIFERQLEKCRVDHFDFYLFHCLNDGNIDAYLDPKYGIYDYLMAQKAKGRIGHLGFSAHASLDTVKRFLAAYGKDIEFCQLQINWMDWDYQNVKEYVKVVASHGIPIWVMEPVRGGALVKLKGAYEEYLETLRPGVKPAEWAFRFIQSIPEVVMTLSGMSNLEQVKDNIETFKTEQPTTDKEREVLFSIGRAMTAKTAIQCTACRYCTTHCPQDLNIPWLIELYNEHIHAEGDSIAPRALAGLAADKLPSACLGCGACEAVCPQSIKIRDMMTDFTDRLK